VTSDVDGAVNFVLASPASPTNLVAQDLDAEGKVIGNVHFIYAR
jgi:hypothetical protein